MRRQVHWLSFVPFLWTMIGCSVFADDPAPKFMAKDSFEQGADAPTGWSQGADIQGVTYVYAQNAASDGKRSLSLQKSEQRYFPIAQWYRPFKHISGKSFLKIMAKVKAEKAAKAIIDAQFLDATDDMISHEWVSYIGQKKPTDKLANHDWKSYEGTVAIPKGTAQIVIAFQIYGPGKVWFDELEAVYVDKVATVDDEPSKQPASSGTLKSNTNNPVESTEKVPSRTDAEMHVIGIYRPKDYETKRVDVKVRPTTKPVVLVLTAYYAANWHVTLAEGAQLEKVIVSGYFEQEIAGLPGNTPVVNRSYFPSDASRREHGWFYAYKWNTFEYRRMVETLNDMTGLLVSTFQSKYDADTFVIDGTKGHKLAQKQRRERSKPTAEFTSRELLAACQDAELHLVGIYSAEDGKNGDVVQVDVRPTKKPIVLALASYYSVLWKVNIDPQADVKAVIIGGYFEQEFEGISPEKVPVVTRSYFPNQNRDFFYGFQRDSKEYSQMAERLTQMTGLTISTFQGRNNAASFVVDGTIRPQTPPKSPETNVDPFSDVADVPSQELRAGGDVNKRYFLIGPQENTEPPAEGYHLLVVLPGGDGSADFHPFVRRVFKHALPDGYIIVQPVAFKWTPDQQIVWPTNSLPVEKMKFGTEEFIEAMIQDVSKKHELNRNKIYSLSWSSSGPAAYATSLTKNTSIKGSFIAMSVFVPKILPALANAKGHAYYLYHSKEDRICPYTMAEQANTILIEQGAEVRFKTYTGGHGWASGAIFEDIREGIDWLEERR